MAEADTARQYWNLTSAIYRFTPTPDDGSCRNIHSESLDFATLSSA